MKKTLFFATVLALMASATVFCNKPDQGGTDNTETTYTLPAPKFVNDAVSVSFKSNESQFLELGDMIFLPDKLIFTEGGRYALFGKEGLKSYGDRVSISGKYTKDGNTYMMAGFGKAVFDGNKLTLTPDSGKAVEYDVNTQKPSTPSGNNENNIARAWKPGGDIKVSIPSKGISTTLAPNFESIAGYLEEHGVSGIDKATYKGYEIESINLSLAEMSFLVNFTNQKAYLGNWKWTNMAKGEFSYTFGAQWGGEMINGTADGSVKFVSNNRCDFVMNITVKGTTAELKFSLVEA